MSASSGHGTYTDPALRERIKRRIMRGSEGGKPGQWSARKAQLVASAYARAGGGYVGGKRATQRHLDAWTAQRWRTRDGDMAQRTGGTARYLPDAAWRELTPAQAAATDQKKRKASRGGQQTVANTGRAAAAGSHARHASAPSGRTKRTSAKRR